jgi:phosphoserine phosphatase RsbU/P
MASVAPELIFGMGVTAGALATGVAATILGGHHRRETNRELDAVLYERQSVAAYMDKWVHAIAEGSSRKELLEGLVKTTQASTGATLGAVFEKQEDNLLTIAASSGLFPPLRAIKDFPTRAQTLEHLLLHESYHLGDGLVGNVARAQEPLFIEDALHDARVFHSADKAFAVRSLILAPIVFQETLLGVLALANPQGRKRFNNVDFRVAVSLGKQAALALHNADAIRTRLAQHRFDFDLSVASSIQTMLLPAAFPANNSLEIAARYQPAQKVGGDLYDVFELPEGLVGIVIADVSGKGVPASLLMAICQSHLRHLAKKHHSPARVLSELNQILQPEIRHDMFVTVTYAVVDPEGNQIILARAGHELPLKISAEGTCEFLKSDGVAVGMAPQPIFERAIEEKRFPFAQGDTLIFYTDGLTEAINTLGEEFSSRRLADLARQTPGASADEINARLLRAVENFTSRRHQDDDITLLTLKHL